MPFSLYLALKYLKPKRSFVSVVTAISIIGVLLGVAIPVIVLSIFTGFGNVWNEKILSFKPHLTVYSRMGAVTDEESLCQRIEKVPGVNGAAPVVFVRTLVQHRGRTVAPIVVGIDPDRAPNISRVPEFVNEGGEFDLWDDRVVIGSDLASRLGARVGDRILVYSPRTVMNEDEMYLPKETEVAGIFDMGMRDFDGEFIIGSLELARDLVGLDEGSHAVYVMTDNPREFAERQYAVQQALGYDFLVRSWRDEDQVLFSALQLEKTMMIILLIFISIVAIFCVTNTLIVITVQKTNEIGLLKALGFRSWKIMSVFVWHGSIQCLIGELLGIGTAFLVLFNLTAIVDWIGELRGEELFPKEIYGLDAMPWEISAVEVIWVAVTVLVMCTLASLVPAFRAARMDPVRALRHE